MKTQPSNASLWAQFAAAAVSRPSMNSTSAAQTADQMLKHFHERFVWEGDADTGYWKQKNEHHR